MAISTLLLINRMFDEKLIVRLQINDIVHLPDKLLLSSNLATFSESYFLKICKY